MSSVFIKLEIDSSPIGASALARAGVPITDRAVSTDDVFPAGQRPPFERARPDWDTWSTAVDDVLERAGLTHGPAPSEIHVAAAAPLALTFQLGTGIGRFFSGETIAYGPRGDGAWLAYRSSSERDAVSGAYFTERPTLPSSPDGEGWVRLVIAVGGAIDAAQLRDEPEGQFRPLTLASPHPLDAASIGVCLAEIRAIIDAIPSAYGRQMRGLALYLRCPAPLALHVGRMINATVYPAIRVYNFAPSTGYALAVELPRHARFARQWNEVAPAHARDLARAARDELEKFFRTVQPEYLPPDAAIGQATREAMWTRLQDVARRTPEMDETIGARIDPLFDRRLAIGPELFYAHDPRIDVAFARRHAVYFVLHELFHYVQGLAHNFQNVGRGGVVLEEVDYAADAFAVGTLFAWSLARGGAEARDERQALLAGCADSLLRGLEAFDRYEQGPRIRRLAERRLRRYLIWHLQRARLRRLGHDFEPAHVWAVLWPRPFVEVGPIAGHLDHNAEKLVRKPDATAELFVALRGALIRRPGSAVFDPVRLVEAVRAMDGAGIDVVMRDLVANAPALAP